MSKPTLKVDADNLRALSVRLESQAKSLDGLDPSALARGAEAAMAATATGVAAAGIADPVVRAAVAVAETVRSMSKVAFDCANDYEAIDSGFARVLSRYQAGLR